MDGGECIWKAKVNCPPDAFCHPPAPLPLDCSKIPPEELSSIRERDADEGTCYGRYTPKMRCPPGARCNPPPPREIERPCPRAEP